MCNKNPKISIIIPCYNVSNYIDKCVSSLVSQTIGLDSLECIFVDDASTDDTLQKLAVWESKYPDNILVIHCEENGKQGQARNIGLNYATADYIGYIDSDDYIEPTMYQRLYDTIITHNVDLVECGYIREYEDGSIASEGEHYDSDIGPVTIDTPDDRREFLKLHMGGGVWNKLYRKSVIIDNDIAFPANLSYEDNYFASLHTYYISSYYILSDVLYHYCVNYDSTIMKTNSYHHLDRLVIEVMKVEAFINRGIINDFHDEIELDFLLMYFINTLHILFVRFNDIPYDIIYEMQNVVKTLFPNHATNPLLPTLGPIQLELLKLVDMELNEAKINAVANAYRELL